MSNRIIAIIDQQADSIAGAMELAMLSVTAQMEIAMRSGVSMNAFRSYAAQTADILGRVPTIFKLSWGDAENALNAALSAEPHPSPVTALADASDAQKLREFALQMIVAHLEYVRADLGRRFREVMLTGSTRAPDNQLFHRTRDGREIRSREFIFLTVRKALLDYANSIRLASVRARGGSRFAVWHPDVNHPSNGLVIEVEDFPDVQGDIFHPRSSALVALEVPDAPA